MEVLELAQAIFGCLVPKCVQKGYIGNPSRLAIYVMERIQGITYIEARMKYSSLADGSKQLWQKNVVVDFAR